MCLAIPALVVELLAGDACRVELGGIRKEVSLALVDGVAVGDYVIVHVGYALTRLDPDEAAETLALLAAAGERAPADDSVATPPPGARP
ncbi:HypC/HybG/HupF family hydrogenase formation chaperone [Thauera sp. WH-1]|uniref:HypC/HybG/HupF family hydrogenase formation chaperone n=1 Tax=Thauera sp. WH-1 TaxID=3398230 RepID=UPI0039FB9E85